jgi:putrescine transport system substrate-binding protein
MKKSLIIYLVSIIVLCACNKNEESKSVATQSSAQESEPVISEEKILNIYNWADYIPEGMLQKFEQETGIKVNYDTFETSEALNAKLVAGNTGYDIVVTGTSFSPAQTEAGFFQPINKSKLQNFGNLDPVILMGLNKADPENKYLVPWAWGFTTVGINKTKVEKALGKTPFPENVWDLVLNPEYTAKLKSCGIAYLDSPTEIMPVALHYVGKNPYAGNAEDLKLAVDALKKVRKDIRIFSSTMIDDIATGKVCAVIGWSGDINIAFSRAKESGTKDVIEALLPSTGALMWFDTMAITQDSKHPSNAHAFIDFYLKAENAAQVSDEMSYPTGNKAALQKMKPEIVNNKTIFVDTNYFAKLVAPAKFTNEVRESMANAYNAFKKGK